MTLVASFTIPGKPVPKARVRFDRRSGRAYTPFKSRAYEKRVAAEAYSASRWDRDLEAKTMTRRDDWPEKSSCARERSTRRAGKSSRCRCAWCASAVELDLRIYLPDRRTRDIDNIAKSLLDGMNGVLFRDDRQVCATAITKELDRANPRVEVVVRLEPPVQGALGIDRELVPVQCSGCEGVGSFPVGLPSGKRREVVCGDCGGSGKARGSDLGWG